MALNLLGLGGSRLGLPSTSGAGEERRVAGMQTDEGRYGRLGRLATALLRRVPFAGRLLGGRKRGREEFEAPDEGAGPGPGQEEGEEEVGELRAALERAEAALAAERALGGGAFAYAYPEVQLTTPQGAGERGGADGGGRGAPGPRGERARLREAIGEAERARRRCAERRTGVFVAAEGAAGPEAAEAAEAALPDDVLLYVFELAVRRGQAEGALPEAHRLLCAAGRVCRRWRRLASDPRLWAHALQLPWALHALAALPRFRGLSHLQLDLFVDRALPRRARRPGAGGAGAGPPPLPGVVALELRVFRVQRSVLGVDRTGRRVPVPERLPWLPACSGDQRGALGARFRGSRSEAFDSAARLLRVAERFPGLRRLSLPGEGRGYFPAIKSLGGPSSRIEELDAHVHFGRETNDVPLAAPFLREFPRLERLRSASACTEAHLLRMLEELAPPSDLAGGGPALRVGKVKVGDVAFERPAEPGFANGRRPADLLRACVERLRPRALLLSDGSGLRHIGAAIGPSVQKLSLGPRALHRLQNEDIPWIAGNLTSIHELSLEPHRNMPYDPAVMARLFEAIAALPGLRRLVIRGAQDEIMRDGAARLAELRAARGLGPASVAVMTHAAIGEPWEMGAGSDDDEAIHPWDQDEDGEDDDADLDEMVGLDEDEEEDGWEHLELDDDEDDEEEEEEGEGYEDWWDAEEDEADWWGFDEEEGEEGYEDWGQQQEGEEEMQEEAAADEAGDHDPFEEEQMEEEQEEEQGGEKEGDDDVGYDDPLDDDRAEEQEEEEGYGDAGEQEEEEGEEMGHGPFEDEDRPEEGELEGEEAGGEDDGADDDPFEDNMEEEEQGGEEEEEEGDGDQDPFEDDRADEEEEEEGRADDYDEDDEY
eukprot:tig00000523_g1833.t1